MVGLCLAPESFIASEQVFGLECFVLEQFSEFLQLVFIAFYLVDVRLFQSLHLHEGGVLIKGSAVACCSALVQLHEVVDSEVDFLNLS